MRTALALLLLTSSVLAYTPTTWAFPSARAAFGPVYVSGFRVPKPASTGEWIAAGSAMSLAGVLLVSTTVLPWLPERKRRAWYPWLGAIGAAGWLGYFAAHLVK